jgi:tetratricopeptide repeat protein
MPQNAIPNNWFDVENEFADLKRSISSSDPPAMSVQVMETSLRVLGKEHPDALTSMANLASTYRNQRRWKEAEDLGVDNCSIRDEKEGVRAGVVLSHVAAMTPMSHWAVHTGSGLPIYQKQGC